MRRVVITGIGPVCSGKFGSSDFFLSLLNKETLLESIPEAYEKHYKFKTRFFVPAPQLSGPGFERSMDEVTRIAVEASRLALLDAGLENLLGGGVVMGIGVGGLNAALPSYLSHAAGIGRFNRLVIPQSMANSPAAWIQIKYQADHESYTVNAACASGSVALGEAFRKVRDGYMDLALTGGVECLLDPTGAIFRGFDVLQVLTRSEDGLPRPFSKDRSGFLFNMGAGCSLILEERERAIKRGARIYAEFVDYATCSAGNIVALPVDPTPIVNMFHIADGLKVDYFNAHGTGTVPNDAMEAEIVRRVWGDQQPYIGASKGLIGHCIGASGALEAAVTALSVYHGKVHGNLTANPIDGLNCPINSDALDIEYALSASYGFGGHNALLLFRRHRD